MSGLATLEAALWGGHYEQLAHSHSHRAVREDSLGVIKGRDAIQAAWIATGPADVTVTADLDDMIAVAGNGWSLHRWVWREDGRIVREIAITDRVRNLSAPPVHPPLGELRAARGQFAASDAPDLPPQFPSALIPLATQLHRQWNGRNFADGIDPVIASLIRDLPDAFVQFEHGVASHAGRALLFRLFGHHPNGQRVRLIGSVVDSVDLTIDVTAYRAQLDRGLIAYD